MPQHRCNYMTSKHFLLLVSGCQCSTHKLHRPCRMRSTCYHLASSEHNAPFHCVLWDYQRSQKTSRSKAEWRCRGQRRKDGHHYWTRTKWEKRKIQKNTEYFFSTSTWNRILSAITDEMMRLWCVLCYLKDLDYCLLVSCVGEMPWWLIQGPGKGRKKG